MAITIPDRKIAHHINDGAFEFPYAVDAQHAVSGHPLEWSFAPWDPETTADARKRLHEQRVAEAEKRGEAPPVAPVEPDLTDEERAIIAEHRKKQAEAQKLLDEAAAEEAKKNEKAVALDDARAVLASQPSLPPRRPGRPPTKAAATAAAAKAEADRKAEAERKAEADRKAATERERARQAAPAEE